MYIHIGYNNLRDFFILPLDFSVVAELPSSNSWLPDKIIEEIEKNFIKLEK